MIPEVLLFNYAFVCKVLVLEFMCALHFVIQVLCIEFVYIWMQASLKCRVLYKLHIISPIYETFYAIIVIISFLIVVSGDVIHQTFKIYLSQ